MAAHQWMAEARAGMKRKGTVGALHREMGVPMGKKMPAGEMEAEMARLHKKSKGAGGKGLTIGERRRARRLAFAKAARG